MPPKQQDMSVRDEDQLARDQSLDQLKDLAKSQNPVVVSCRRKQPPTARLCIGHLAC